MMTKMKSIIFLTFLLLLILMTSCKKEVGMEVIIGESVFTITDEEFKNDLINQLLNWELGKDGVFDADCFMDVRISNPSHDICIMNTNEIYLDGYKVNDEKMNKQWISKVLAQIKQGNKLLPLFMNSESIILKANDIQTTILLDSSSKQVLFEILIQFEVFSDNQTIGYGFPSYPAYQIWFDDDMLYVASFNKGITSLFHNEIEYHIKTDKIQYIFDLVQLPEIDGSSLMSLYGSEVVTFQTYIVKNGRVDPVVRFLISESEANSQLPLGQDVGEIIFTKNGLEEIVIVYDNGFAYKEKNYYLPSCPDVLASVFSAG